MHHANTCSFNIFQHLSTFCSLESPWNLFLMYAALPQPFDAPVPTVFVTQAGRTSESGPQAVHEVPSECTNSPRKLQRLCKLGKMGNV